MGQVPTTMSPVLPEAAKLLLPAIKMYVSNISFEGTRDVRVLDHAPKHPRSQSRRREAGPRLPFPLQDEEGRLASIERLYEYAGERLSPRDDVAGQAIRHLHPEILPWDAWRLGNQVHCTITEYHLMSSARVSTTMSPVLLEAAKLLLPAINMYVSNISFEGTQDVRVLDHTKTL